jgi:flagellar protein FlaG
MGSVSASHLVIFIASLIVAAGVAGTLVTEVDRVSGSITDQSDGMSESIETDVQIISDRSDYGAIYDGSSNNVTLLVKNVGGTGLSARSGEIDVLIEGRFIASANVTVELVEDGRTGWEPGAVVRIEASLDGAFDTLEGETRGSVAVNGNEDTIRFRA